jgi:hypothetical protein
VSEQAFRSVNGFDKRAADRLAREVARLIDIRIVGSRSAVADALLDYLQVGGIEGPKSVPEWCEAHDAKGGGQ